MKSQREIKGKHKLLDSLPLECELLTPDEIAKKIKVPAKVNDDLKVLIYIGLPRGCSTATTAAFGNLPWLLKKVHFQPLKYIQRYSNTLEIDFLNMITADQEIVFLKETPGGPNYYREVFDPIDILLKSGLVAKHIKCTISLRHPLWQFESWLKANQERSVKLYLAGQKKLIEIEKHYRATKVKVIPFITELYCGMELDAFNALIRAYDIDQKKYPISNSLTFENSNKSIYWYEANPQINSSYYEYVVSNVLKKGAFKFPKPISIEELEYIPKYVSKELQKELWAIAIPRYIMYAKRSIDYMYQNTGFRY